MESEDREPIFTRKTFLIILVGILAILIILLMVKKCGKTNNNGGGNVNTSVTGIVVSPRDVGIAPGESYSITVSVEPGTAKDKTFNCSSDNLEVVTVTTNVETGTCIALGVKEGNATVYATTMEGNYHDGCAITVKAATSKLTGITLDSEEYEIQVNEKKQVSVSAIPEDAQIPELTYEMSDTAIAEVSAKGEITGKKIGEATLMVKTADSSAITAALVKVVEQKSCPDGQEKVDGVCVAKCKSNQERIDGKCVAKCKSTQKRDDDGKCVPKCKSTQELVDGKCVAKCKSTQIRNDKGKCVAKNQKVAPTKITLKEKTITLTVGDTFDIKDNFTIKPETAAQKITCKVKSTTYLSQKNCVITAKKKTSSTTVKICAKADSKICATLKVKIKAKSSSGGGPGGSNPGGSNPGGSDTQIPGDKTCTVTFSVSRHNVYANLNYDESQAKNIMFLNTGSTEASNLVTKEGYYRYQVVLKGTPTTYAYCSQYITAAEIRTLKNGEDTNVASVKGKEEGADYECGKIVSRSNKDAAWTKDNVTVIISCIGADCEKTQFQGDFGEKGKTVDKGNIYIKNTLGKQKKCEVVVHYDNEAPTITCKNLDKTSSTGIRINVIRQDSGSGVKNSESKNITYTITESRSFFAHDNLGNTSSCKVTINASTSCPSSYPTHMSSLHICLAKTGSDPKNCRSGFTYEASLNKCIKVNSYETKTVQGCLTSPCSLGEYVSCYGGISTWKCPNFITEVPSCSSTQQMYNGKCYAKTNETAIYTFSGIKNN